MLTISVLWSSRERERKEFNGLKLNLEKGEGKSEKFLDPYEKYLFKGLRRTDDLKGYHKIKKIALDRGCDNEGELYKRYDGSGRRNFFYISKKYNNFIYWCKVDDSYKLLVYLANPYVKEKLTKIFRQCNEEIISQSSLQPLQMFDGEISVGYPATYYSCKERSWNSRVRKK